jgi:murein DD-endopeptidase MepM/ murein hydrolase activator NlpD
MTKRLGVFIGALALVAIGVWLWSKTGPVLHHPIVALRLVREAPAAQLPIPVDGVTPRQLQDTWGAARSGHRHHQGIDIFAPHNTPIRSATDGIVATVGDNKLGGHIVRVFGPAGEWHYYAHLDHFAAIHPGDVITRGTLLGYVGDTGNAKGTPFHLHYGIYRRLGGAMNPYPRLAAVRSGTAARSTGANP